MEHINKGLQLEATYLTLPETFYTIQGAMPVKKPTVVLFNDTLAQSMGLDLEVLKGVDWADILSGNKGIDGAPSFAECYSGHQFGYFNRLGDGRALVLGEQVTPSGVRLDIQLKGSGPTPYSRRGDGRATLSAMLREYLISESMAALGIATTRSLALVTTGESVYRESVQDGAILTRVALSHIRVGTFQYAASQGTDALMALFEYTLNRHYPECKGTSQPVASLLFEFAKRQAKLIASWQSVGFVHGVMNTDNVTLSGETIDYGPCAFIDAYDPDSVFSAIDTTGRYRLKHQPPIGKWNLARFAETLLPLLGEDAKRIANESLEYFDEVYEAEWQAIMQRKLGLLEPTAEGSALVRHLLSCMASDGMDYHDTFVKLTLGDGFAGVSKAFEAWHEAWMALRQKAPYAIELQVETMKAHNPTIVPRNHLVEQALYQWTVLGDSQPYLALMTLLKTPYAYTPHHIEKGAPQMHWPKTYTTTCGT